MRWRLMDGVPEEEVRRLLSIARRRRFSRNEVVFHREDPANSLHLISKALSQSQDEVTAPKPPS